MADGEVCVEPWTMNWSDMLRAKPVSGRENWASAAPASATTEPMARMRFMLARSRTGTRSGFRRGRFAGFAFRLRGFGFADLRRFALAAAGRLAIGTGRFGGVGFLPGGLFVAFAAVVNDVKPAAF